MSLIVLEFSSGGKGWSLRLRRGQFPSGDLPAHKLFNCGQRSCDGGCQLLAAIEGVTGDRDKKRTRTGLEYGLRVVSVRPTPPYIWAGILVC
jgi:hypothetical protein